MPGKVPAEEIQVEPGATPAPPPTRARRRTEQAAVATESDAESAASAAGEQVAEPERHDTAGAPPRTLRVTWIRSAIGHRRGAHGTIRALGLHRLHETVQVADTPSMRGMLRRVAFLIRVEEPALAGTADAGTADAGTADAARGGTSRGGTAA